MQGIDNVDWEGERRLLEWTFRIWFGAEEAEERAQSALCMLWDNARRFDVSLSRARKIAVLKALTGRRFCGDPARRPLCALRGKTQGKHTFRTIRLGWAAGIVTGSGELSDGTCSDAIDSSLLTPSCATEVDHCIDLTEWIGTLTPSQRRVLVCLRIGYSIRETAFMLGMSDEEVWLVRRNLQEHVPANLVCA